MPRHVIERTPPASARAARVSAGTLLLLERRTLRDLRAARDEAIDEAVAGVTRQHEKRNRAALLALLLIASRTMSAKVTAAVVAGRQRAREGARGRFRAELAALGIVLGKQFGHPGHRHDEDYAHAHSSADALASMWRVSALHAAVQAHRRGENVAQAIDETRARMGGPKRTAATETSRAYNDEHREAAFEAVEEIAAVYPEIAPWLVRMWSAILDGRVCRECKAHDGEITTLGGHFEGGDEPGELHPNCRCTGLIVAVPRTARLVA